jgi:glucose-6-phosphate isomerase
MDARMMWDRYRRYLSAHPSIGLLVDVSRMKFPVSYLEDMRAPAERAFDAMEALERGAIANPDEGRQVGHYWLRAPQLAPSPEIRGAIEQTLARVMAFAADVHAARVRPAASARFSRILLVGIGGSALGPQLVDNALRSPSDPMRACFLDNTDPDGIDRVLAEVGVAGLADTLVLVVSKSGGTKETRNGMLEVEHAFARASLPFPAHAVAVTKPGSELDDRAAREGWLARFPMWDWVGGRTSETSAVGLLPAALQGFDVDALLAGARDCDSATRVRDPLRNPAMLLALMWLLAAGGSAVKDMVVLPYKDRLALLTRYLQQLVMESLGKGRDLTGNVVRHGIAVYGNKGSTDQHAYVQQLREGIDNFFVTFVEVLRDREGPSIEVEPGVTSGDYLLGFQLGTRKALFDNNRDSISITIDEVSARSLGMLIALHERAVGFYASLVGINAYHQPGVEAGKKAASRVIALQRDALALLTSHRGEGFSLQALARALGADDEVETLFKVLEHLAANPARGVARASGASLFEATYSMR